MTARIPLITAFLALPDPASLWQRMRRGGGAVAPRGQGSLCLVGAGPGAPDLLTLRAVQRLQDADAIYYDRLIDPAILGLVRPGADRVYVGKAVGANAWPQDRINRVIVAAAMRGQKVVRLKSGDPGIFGRAGEEIAAAADAGIPVEIVPGLTAASAAAAGLGRSLTERGQTDRLLLATATCRPGDPDPDWASMLAPGTTLVLYMAMHVLETVQAGLRAAGLPEDAPLDIVQSVSRTDQRHLATTVAGLCADVATHRIGNPAVLMVRRPKRPDDAAAPAAQIASALC